MGCWVAPSIAAEIWGVTLADVASLISSGALPTQSSGSFNFIRLPRYSAPGVAIPASQRPSTYNCIASRPTPPPPPPEPEPTIAKIEPTPIIEEDPELGPPPDEDPNDNRISGWRAGRQASSTRRRPPGAR